MTQPITIAVEFEGTDQAEDSVDRIIRGLDAFEKKVGEAAGKTAAMADVVGRFATAIRSRGVADVARFTSELARSVQAGAELGRMFGPGGAVVGGITGGMLPAIERVIRATDEASQAANRMSEAYVRAGEEARRAMLSIRQQADVAAGVFGSDTSDDDLVGLQQQRSSAIVGLEREIARLDRSRRRDGISEDSTTIPQLRQEVEQARRELAGIQTEIQRREARALADQQQRDAAAIAGLTPREEQPRGGGRAGGGESAQEREQAAWDRYNASVLSGLQMQDEARQLLIDTMIAEGQKAEELAQERLDADLAAKASLEAVAAREIELIQERVRAQQEADDLLIEANRSAYEAHQREVESYQEVTGVIVGGLTDALTAITAGEKTAEEAFSGLLASFLKYIAEQATLKAIFEGAEAISAFASQKYDAGAMHLAAAGAYIGVAVAAGAASVAVASSASGSRQSEPERGRSSSGGDGGGGQIVVNWNSPVVTAGTRAELGRELSQMIGAGQSRFA